MKRTLLGITLSTLFLFACGAGGAQLGNECTPGQHRCENNVYERCADDGNSYVPVEDCNASSEICSLADGCITCVPNGRTCNGFDIMRCSPDGHSQDLIASCDPEDGDICFEGNCANACELADGAKSYEGCEYYAVDLDNAVVANQGTAAAQQFSVVLSNASQLDAVVTVDIYCTKEDSENIAIQCTEGEIHTVRAFSLAPDQLKIVDLDAREVDGASKPHLNDGPGTFRSMHAYRISSTAPLIAYQFNPLENVNVFSNDASLLLHFQED